MAYRIEKVSCVNLGFTIRIFVTASSASREELLGLSSVWSVIKFAAEQAGLDSKSVRPKILRRSFRKTLNATESHDEDTKEALMGHRLPGSRLLGRPRNACCEE